MRPRTFARLLRLAAPFRWWMALAALLGFATIGSSIGLMSAAAWIIASAALHPSISTLSLAIVGVRFFGIARGVLRYLERVVSHQATFRLLARLRVWFYRELEPLAPARLMEHRSGDLLARAVADINTLENVYLRVIAPPVVAVLTGLLMMVFMGAYDPALALALVFFLVTAGIGVPLLARGLGRQPGRDLVTARADLNVALLDGIQGLPDLVASGAQDRHAGRVHDLGRAVQRHQARLAWIGGLHTALFSLMTSLAVLAVLWIAIPLVTEGRIDGVLLAVLALATMASFEAVQPLPAAFTHLESSLEAARRLFEIVDAAPAVTDPPNPVRLPDPATLPPDAPLLRVENLHFRYTPDDPPALDGISFTLPPGGTLAVVGASGAGKSTLAHLLLRFWDVAPGMITLAGHDLRDCAQDDVRALFGVVSQHTALFTGTIRENLLIARLDAAPEEMIHAATLARLHPFVESLPQGYDTWIGEQGLALSGGERQRIAIARAILKDAPILLLDEPTANLDPVTEREVMAAIRAAMPGRATILITHRLVGLDAAGEIIVLHAGRIVERGRHTDLLRRAGTYRRLWDAQPGGADEFSTER